MDPELLSGPILALAKRQAGLLSRAQLLNAGFTRRQIEYRAQTGRWERALAGVYHVLPGYSWRDPYTVRRMQSAWLGLLAVPSGIATGLCALALHRVWGLPLKIRPEVAVPQGNYRCGRGNVWVRQIAPFPTHEVNGRHIAAPVPALVQALPALARDTAVSILDSACNRKLIQPEHITQIARELHGKRGSRKVYPWLRLVEAQAESPFETLARLQCLDAGLPPPRLQVEVWDEVSLALAHGDMGWQRSDGTWVLVDLDGRRYHETPKALLADRRRQNAIALTGRHTHLRFAWEDLRAGVIPGTIARALRESTFAAS